MVGGEAKFIVVDSRVLYSWEASIRKNVKKKESPKSCTIDLGAVDKEQHAKAGLQWCTCHTVLVLRRLAGFEAPNKTNPEVDYDDLACKKHRDFTLCSKRVVGYTSYIRMDR